MAVDIARFLSGIESPVARVQQGVTFGQQQADRRATQEAARAQAEQQKKVQAELLALSQKENRTADDFQDLIIRNPGLADTFKSSIAQLNTEARNTVITDATNVFAALSGGNTDAAIKLLEDRKEAAENSGDQQEVQTSEILIQAIKASPEAALTSAGLFLAQATGPEKFASTFEAITPKAREVFRPATPQELSGLGLPEGTPGVQVSSKTGRAFIPGRGVSVRVGDTDKSAAAKAATGFLTEVIEKGNASTEILNNADLLDLSLNKVGGTAFDTGIFGELRSDLGRLAILTGQGEAFRESIAGAENIDSISQKLKILETQALKGAISNREFAAAGKINTDLGNTNLGNRFAVKRMRAVANMSQWQNQRFEEIDNANPDITDKELSRLLKKEFRGIPYVSQKLKDGSGLPLFFTEFRNEVLKDDPNISTKELIKGWRVINK